MYWRSDSYDANVIILQSWRKGEGKIVVTKGPYVGNIGQKVGSLVDMGLIKK